MNKNNTINNTIDWTWEYDRNDVLDRGKTEDLTPIPKDPVDPRLLATVTHDSEHESLLIESGRLDPYHTPVDHLLTPMKKSDSERSRNLVAPRFRRWGSNTRELLDLYHQESVRRGRL